MITEHVHPNPAGSKFCNACGASLLHTVAPIISIHWVLDESGSMEACRQQTIEGFNSYINNLRTAQEVQYRCSLTKFSSDRITRQGGFVETSASHRWLGFEPIYRTMFTDHPIALVPYLDWSTFAPEGNTPLYDAMGHVINSIVQSDNRKILVITLTDGKNNASRSYSRESIFNLIRAKEIFGNWSFVYMGANQDSYEEATHMGYSVGNIANYNVLNTKAVYTATARATQNFAAAAPSATMDFLTSEKAIIEQDTPTSTTNGGTDTP